MLSRPLIIIAAILLINLLQSAFTQLTGDEALYWMYWNHLDFGYRDHPPLIGVLIGIGYSICHSELGVRLFTVVANSAMIYALWCLIKPDKVWQFFLLVLSIPVMSLYGFIATPDAPLMLCTALYLLVWKKFIDGPSLRLSLLLGVCMAALMWSKYHGIFIILFTWLPLRKLWFHKWFWLAGLVGIILFSPHLVWQVLHDLPTIKFHLNERNSDAWELKHILGYAGGQLGVFNPIVLVLMMVIMTKTRATNDFERSLRWLIGILLVLFLLNSCRGRVEPHWTAPLTLAAIYLICTHWKLAKPKNAVIAGLSVFAVLVLCVRFFAIFDVLPQMHRDFHRDKPKMMALKKIAGELPVCFMNSYQNPSLYNFYTGGKAHSINNVNGGKNQYDYWQHNEYMHEKQFLFVYPYHYAGFSTIEQDGFQFETQLYDHLPVLHHLVLWTDEWLIEAKANDSINIPAWLINRNHYGIDLSGEHHTIAWQALMNHKKPNGAKAECTIQGIPSFLAASDSARVSVLLRIPDRPGRNRMCIAAQLDSLQPTYQSNWMRVMVNQ